jgi:hypothetical protein
LFNVKLTQDKVIHFEDLEFTANHPDNLSLSPKRANSGAIAEGMTHSGSLSLHAILKELPSEDDSASSEGESSGFPLLRACNIVISVIPIATTPPPEETLVPQTIQARPQRTATPTPLPEQLTAHQEE